MSQGRNELCACGSLKKYKKCCEVKEFEAAAKEDRELQEWLEMDFADGERFLKELLEGRVGQ